MLFLLLVAWAGQSQFSIRFSLLKMKYIARSNA
jgi:hypothetical protein